LSARCFPACSAGRPVAHSANIAYRFSKDKETGRFRGIAFITFPSLDIAESAVRNLNQVSLKGREIYLDFSRSRSDDRGRDRDRGGGPGDRGDLRGPGPRDRTRDGYPSDRGGGDGYGGGGGGGGAGPPQYHQFPHQGQPQMGGAPGFGAPGGGQMGHGGAPASMAPGQQGQGQPIFLPQGQGQGMPQTIIVQPDGRQVILAPGQPLPMGMQLAPQQQQQLQRQHPQQMGQFPGGAAPQGGPQDARQAAAGSGAAGPAIPAGQPFGMAQPGGGGPQQQQLQGPPGVQAAAQPKAPSELPHNLPIGQATAFHVRPLLHTHAFCSDVLTCLCDDILSGALCTALHHV
jgi:RNA recognition motif. (a.k.a. RRM, RBD, or RNP domain)